MCNSKLSYQKNSNGHYVCHECTFTSRIQSTMHYHLKKHMGDLPFNCQHCDAKFAQKSLLDLHIASKHDEKSEKQVYKCPCNNCDYKDIRKGNRLIHFVRVHLKDIVSKLRTKSYIEGCVTTCGSCQKDFKNMTQFYYHASNCVSLSDNHPLWNNWLTVK